MRPFDNGPVHGLLHGPMHAVHGHHDARHHHTGRVAPWFVLAFVAFLAAVTVG